MKPSNYMMMLTEIKQTIDKDLLQKRFKCASKTYDKHAVVQKQMAEVLVEMAQKHIPAGSTRMMELGCGTGLLTKEIVNIYRPQMYVANDLVAEAENKINSIINENSLASFQYIKGDAENIEIPGKQDVIWSGATIQWIQDLDTFFMRVCQSVDNQGYFAVSSFGLENFLEVKTITGQGIDYVAMQDVMNVAGKYFNVLEYKSWNRTLWFEKPKDVLKHMKFTGVNALSSVKWGKSNLEQFESGYEKYKTPQGYPLTYHPFIMILQKR